METKWLAALSALFFFFLGWLLFNLGLLPVGQSSLTQGPPIGEVYEIHNQVRRRGLSSLVWEESRKKTPVYHRDTLLTLEGSGAHIKLSNDVDLHLSQNTLVVLEAVSEKSKDGQIHLKFQKGNLRTRHDQGNLTVENQEFTLHAEAGSQVEIQSLGDNQFEITVEEGEATLEAADQVIEIMPGQLLNVENSNLSAPIQRTKELKVQLDIPKRIYSHELPFVAEVTWEGEPDTLEVVTPNRPVLSIPLGEHSTMGVELGEGQHSLRVRKGQSVSAAERLEVLRAPRIHLLFPRPRDRILVNEEQDFVWLSPVDLKDYKIQVQGAEVSKSRKRSSMHQRASLKGEAGRKAWAVVGVDSDGYEIPSLYESPFYLVPSLLEAPTLKSPTPLAPPPVRIPAEESPPPPQSRSSDRPLNLLEKILNTLIPVAHAQEAKVVEPLTLVFEWSKVEGADFYTIELSRRNDFHQLLEESESTKTQWRWTTAETGEIYWRVAGGSRAGAMGKFSEPEKLNLDEIRKYLETRPAQITPSVSVEKPKPVAKAPPPPPKPVPEELVGPPKPPPPPLEYYKFTGSLRGGVHQISLDVTSRDGTHSKMSGVQLTGLEAEGLYHFNPYTHAGFSYKMLPTKWTDKFTGDKLQWTESEAALVAGYQNFTLSAESLSTAALLRPEPQRQAAKPISLFGLGASAHVDFLKVLQITVKTSYHSGDSYTQSTYAAEIKGTWPWSKSMDIETGLELRSLSREGDGSTWKGQQIKVFMGLPMRLHKEVENRK